MSQKLTKEQIQLINDGVLALREKFKRSLLLVARDLCQYKDLTINTHGGAIRLLESNSTRKLLCIPRGCLKTSLLIAYVIWLIIRNPNTTILIESQTYSLAVNILREIKSILVSKRFVNVFGSYEGPVWKEDEIVISARTKPSKDSTAACGSLSTNRIGAHFDYTLLDDMNGPENSNTPENALKVVDHYRLNTSILNPGGTLLVVGTRYSNNDLIGHIIRNEIEAKEGLIHAK